MKREFLKGLGIEDTTTIGKILDKHHKTTGTSATLQKEKEALETQVKTLQETVKKFDGVDANKLKAEIDSIKVHTSLEVPQTAMLSNSDKKKQSLKRN